MLAIWAPSFSKGEYWNPETGTGKKLAKAVVELRKRYGLKASSIVLYGYSAGGQCAALFAQSKELSVAAWGAHGCGVYPDGVVAAKVPALVTCGIGDEDRLRISRSFAMRYREKDFCSAMNDDLGIETDEKPEDEKEKDDTYKIVDKESIEVESRNPLYTNRLSELWRE